MNSPLSVSYCFLAFNEERTIEEVIVEAHAVLSKMGTDFEILVCDDASLDRTSAILQNLTATFPAVRVHRNERNLGIAASTKLLRDIAKKDLVIVNSTDGQWPSSLLFDLLPRTEDTDILVTYRRNKQYTPVRRFVSAVYNLLPRILFGVPVRDAGGLKVVRRDVFERVQIQSQSVFSEAELIIRASRQGLRVQFVPIEYSPRRHGTSKAFRFNVCTSAMLDALRLRLTL